MFFRPALIAALAALAVGNNAAMAATIPPEPVSNVTSLAANALGINCRGSALCDGDGNDANNLAAFIRGVPDNNWYNNGAQIGQYALRCSLGLPTGF